MDINTARKRLKRYHIYTTRGDVLTLVRNGSGPAPGGGEVGSCPDVLSLVDRALPAAEEAPATHIIIMFR